MSRLQHSFRHSLEVTNMAKIKRLVSARTLTALGFVIASQMPHSASEAATPSEPSACLSLSSWPSMTVGSRVGIAHNDMTLIAPHGSFDRNTKELALGVGEQLDANVVWATDSKASFMRRINVNRPTEMRWGMDRKTSTAREVFAFFASCVEKFPSQMSVEVHGDSSKDVVEMATVGVTSGQASSIKAAWGNRFGLPIAIDAAGDDLVMTAGANKRIGLMSRCKGACLHLEIPSHLRDVEMLNTTKSELASFLKAIAP